MTPSDAINSSRKNIFDSVRFGNEMNGAFYSIDSVQGAWNSEREYQEGDKGHLGVCSRQPDLAGPLAPFALSRSRLMELGAIARN